MDAGEFSSQVTEPSGASCRLKAHELRFIPRFWVLSWSCSLLAWLALETLVQELVLSHIWKTLHPRGVHIRHYSALETWLKSEGHRVESLCLLELLGWSSGLFLVGWLLLLLLEVLHAASSTLCHLVRERHECLARNLLLLFVRILLLLCLVVLALFTLPGSVGLILLLFRGLRGGRLSEVLLSGLSFFFTWLLLSG